MPPRAMSKGLLGQVLQSRVKGGSNHNGKDGAAGHSASEDTVDIPTLKKMCTDLLISHRDALGDVGEVDSSLLRPILEACSVQQLKIIESETRLGSDRSLKWDTWDLWRRHYLHEYGQPGLGVKAPPIMTPKPGDYDKTSRPMEALVPADWRKLYEDTGKELLHKQDDTALRMRMRYSQANQGKQRRTAAIEAPDAPQPKRRSTGGSSWGSASSSPASAKERLSSKLGLNRHGESHRGLGVSAGSGSKGARAQMSGGSMRNRQLAAVKPVSRLDKAKPSAVSKLRQKMRASSAPPAGRQGLTKSSGASSSGASRLSLTPQRKALPGASSSLRTPPNGSRPGAPTPPSRPPAARMDVGKIISNIKQGGSSSSSQQ